MDMQALMPQSPTRLQPLKKPCCPGGRTKAGPWLDGTLATTYHDEYTDKEVPVVRASFNYDGPIDPKSKFDASTTYGGDFKQLQPHNRPSLIIPSSNVKLEGGAFQADSMYTQQFGPKSVPYERRKGPMGAPANKGEFFSSTTYNGDFMQRGVPQPAKMIMPGINIEKSGVFAGESTTLSTYTKQPACRRSLTVPPENGSFLPPGGFDGSTSYSSSYVPKQPGRLQPFKPEDAKPMSNDWYEGTQATEYKGQFVDKQIPAPVQPLSPNRLSTVLPKGSFDPSSTYGGAFKAYEPGPRVRAIKPGDAMEREQLPLHGSSTYSDAFNPKAAVPYKRVYPSSRYEPSQAKFEDETAHKAAFPAYAVGPRIRRGPTAGGITKEDHPFEGRTSYSCDFTKMPGALRTQTIVPPNDILSKGPFEGLTTYRKDFVEKEITHREVAQADCDCVEC